MSELIEADVIVVGSGAAGLTTALNLAGGGLNVLCIDFCPLCGREVEKQEALG